MTPYKDAGTLVLNDIVSEAGLYDVAECIGHVGTVQYTHFQGSSHARLDRVYISLEQVPVCNEYQVVPVSFSDHCLVSFVLGSTHRRPKFSWELWKLNCRLLVDEGFTKLVRGLLNKLEEVSSNYAAEWEGFKQEFKMIAIEKACALKGP